MIQNLQNSPIQLIVGLGNPEPKYDHTRHNIGFLALDAIAKSWNISLSENRKFQGLFNEGFTPHNQKIKLLKPLTYMNRSGESIQSVINWYKISPESVLIIYDDMDIQLGKIRLRLQGSAGGHNGMKSAIACLNTENFPRLRIGIGRSNNDKTTISHVLGKFAPTETQLVTDVIKLVVETVEYSLKKDIEKAMSLYNNRTVE